MHYTSRLNQLSTEQPEEVTKSDQKLKCLQGKNEYSIERDLFFFAINTRNILQHKTTVWRRILHGQKVTKSDQKPKYILTLFLVSLNEEIN